MKIYVGKNKLKAKETSLKQLILDSLNIKQNNIDVEHDRFDDDSASWINFNHHLKNTNDGVRLDVTITFNPSDDNIINGMELHMSEKLTGYDEENMQHLK